MPVQLFPTAKLDSHPA